MNSGGEGGTSSRVCLTDVLRGGTASNTLMLTCFTRQHSDVNVFYTVLDEQKNSCRENINDTCILLCVVDEGHLSVFRYHGGITT